MKFRRTLSVYLAAPSLPSRGAWIEISVLTLVATSTASLPSRGAWIEIQRVLLLNDGLSLSLPSRGAWIEMGKRPDRHRLRDCVAPLTGSVD